MSVIFSWGWQVMATRRTVSADWSSSYLHAYSSSRMSSMKLDELGVISLGRSWPCHVQVYLLTHRVWVLTAKFFWHLTEVSCNWANHSCFQMLSFNFIIFLLQTPNTNCCSLYPLIVLLLSWYISECNSPPCILKLGLVCSRKMSGDNLGGKFQRN